MEHHEDLHLIVVSPESTLFDGKVEIVTLPGELGSFSVLYDHAPLISSLIKGEIKYTEDELEKSIGISKYWKNGPNISPMSSQQPAN